MFSYLFLPDFSGGKTIEAAVSVLAKNIVILIIYSIETIDICFVMLQLAKIVFIEASGGGQLTHEIDFSLKLSDALLGGWWIVSFWHSCYIGGFTFWIIADDICV